MILEGFYNKMRNAIAAFQSQTNTRQTFLFGALATVKTFQLSSGALTGMSIHNNTDVDLLVLVSNDTNLTVATTIYTVRMEPQSHYETPYSSRIRVTAILVAGASSGEVAVTTWFNNNNRS